MQIFLGLGPKYGQLFKMAVYKMKDELAMLKYKIWSEKM